MTIFSHDHNICIDRRDALKGHRHKAQGRPRILRPTLGKEEHFEPTPKGLRIGLNPFRVEILRDPIPRVERHKTPLYPGLWADALSGHVELIDSGYGDRSGGYR